MARTSKRFLNLGVSTYGLSARDLAGGYAPLNYTPANVAGESNSAISAHLKGLDTAIGSLGGGGSETTGNTTINNNQSTYSNLTGLVFDKTVTRSVSIRFSVSRNTDTASKAGSGIIEIYYDTQSNNWYLSMEGSSNSGIEFDVTSSGQIQYKSDALSGTSYSSVFRFSYKTFAI